MISFWLAYRSLESGINPSQGRTPEFTGMEHSRKTDTAPAAFLKGSKHDLTRTSDYPG